MKKCIMLLCCAALVLCTADAKKAKKERAGKTTPAAESLPVPEPEPVLTPVRLGVRGDEAEVLWSAAREQLRQQGIDLQLVRYDGDDSPNKALAAGEVELAAYQTQAEFSADCKKNGWQLRSLGSSYAVPCCLCSSTLTDADQLRQGNIVTIPSGKEDAGRALRLLASAGLISLYRDAGKTPTLGDIERNRRGINFRMSQAALKDAVGSAKAAVGPRTAAAALSPCTILYTEPEVSRELWHIIAAREDDGGQDGLLQAVVAAFQSEATERICREEFGGGFVPAGWKAAGAEEPQ